MAKRSKQQTPASGQPKTRSRTAGSMKQLEAYLTSREILRRIQRASTLIPGDIGAARTAGRSLH